MIPFFFGLLLVAFFIGAKQSCESGFLKGFLLEESLQKYLIVFSLILTGVLLTELTLFNFRHYESLFYHEIKVTDYLIGSGLKPTGDGQYISQEAGDKTLEIPKINQELQNIHLDILSQQSEVVKITLMASDEGNQQYYSLPPRELLHQVVQSQYMRLHLYGAAKSLKIAIDASPGDLITIEDFTLNTQVPMVISLRRVLLLQGILMLLFMVRPSSPLYRYSYDRKNTVQRGIIAAYIILQISFFWNVVNLNPLFTNPPWPHHSQYHRLTEAFSEGHFYLKEEPPQALSTLVNPYDYSLRTSSGTIYLWDHVYYKGKYYVYFGVGPVILLYLPYFLLTGTHLPTYLGVFLVSIGAVLAIMALIRAVIEKWFPETPFMTGMLLTSYFINGCGLLYIVKRPDFYNLTILLGLTLSLVGLSYWLTAFEKGRLLPWNLLFGSTCMALVATCRPQLLLGSFLSIVIFRDAVFRDHSLLSRKSLRETLCFLLPFLLVAGGVMYYNAARFGSAFDFGATYNLTTNDMTKRGWVFDRTLLGLVAYLFQPTGFQTNFPFIQNTWLHTGYQGVTIIENPLGGVIYNNLLLLLGLLACRFKSLIQNKTVHALALTSSLFALILIVADTQMAGILMRYLSDFSWLLFLSTTLVALAITQHVGKNPHRGYWNGTLVLFYTLGMSYHSLGIFTDVSESLSFSNPVFTQTVAYLLQFWL